MLRRAAVLATATLAFSLGAGLVAPAQAATRRISSKGPSFSIHINPDAISANPGAIVTYPVSLLSTSRGSINPVFDVDGLPRDIDADIDKTGTRRWNLSLYVPTNAPASNKVYKLIATARGRTSIAYFRLVVVPRTPVPPITHPPVTQPPITQPPITQPPITQPPIVVAPEFNIVVDGPERTTSTDQPIGYPITVDRSRGYTGPVQFAVSGLPSTVQAGFLPNNPTTGNTTLYLTPRAGTKSGRYVMTVTATAGATQRAAVVVMNHRPTGQFALLATPSTATRTSNGAVNYRLDIGTAMSERPYIRYEASGVPTGSTVKFSANDTNAAAVTMTITVGSSTPNGTYYVTVTARSGTATQQVQVQLIVNRPNSGFGLAAQPTAMVIPRGSSQLLAVTVTPAGGFAGSIALSVTGLPAGVTAVFSQNTTVNGSTTTWVQLTAASTAAVTGAVPVTITGSSGALTASIVVSVGVS